MSSDLATSAGVDAPTRLLIGGQRPEGRRGVLPVTTGEAAKLANATEYGLVSYLYSADVRRSLQVAEALEPGMVGINRGVVSDPAAPLGGVKQSGIGREGGDDGLPEFTETKYIAVEW